MLYLSMKVCRPRSEESRIDAAWSLSDMELTSVIDKTTRAKVKKILVKILDLVLEALDI